MNVEIQPSEGAENAEAPNLVQRVIMVFGSPTKLGEVLRSRSPWFWTLAVVALISVVVFALLPPDLMRAAMEAQAAARGQGEGPDPETALKWARYAGIGGALVGPFIAAAVIAGAVYLVFNVLMGQDSRYKQHFSAVAHMYWINTLGFLLLVPVWLSTGDMQTRLGLGLLLADAPSSFVGHFLNGITIFGIWSSSALGAIESGLSGGRLSVGKSIGAVIALYLLWVVISAGWATVTGTTM